jgi:hypothetical protein
VALLFKKSLKKAIITASPGEDWTRYASSAKMLGYE